MKKFLKYTGIVFLVLVGIGLLGNLMGIEPETQDSLEVEQKAEEEAKVAAEKEAAQKAEEEAKVAAEKEAAQKAEEEAKVAAEKEAAQKAEEEAKVAAEKEAAQKAEEEAKVAAEKEAAQKAEEEAKVAAEKEAAQKAEEEAKVATENAQWENIIQNIILENASPADRFYALERYIVDYNSTREEAEIFSEEIVMDYLSGTYLSDISNDERMLTNIFKASVVEKEASGLLKDFAFDYYQNIKYTYRGVDAVDSEAVRSNEQQMNRALSEM